MRNIRRHVTLTCGALAGGLLAGAFLPAAVAFADDYGFIPDPNTFAITQAEGYPPLYNEVTGTEHWSLADLTSAKVEDFYLQGIDTSTTFGSFTNDDFVSPDLSVVFGLGKPEVFGIDGPVQIDLANFGGGFENEWIDLPSGLGSSDPGVSDLLITPFGDFQLVGSAFSDLAAAVLAGESGV